MLRRAWWGPWPSLRASPFHTPALPSPLHNARPSSNAINTALSQIATTLPCKATRLTNWKMFNSLPQTSSPRDMAPDTGSFSFEYLPNLNPSKGLKSLPNNSVRSTNYAQVAPSPLVNQLQSISVRRFSSYYCCFPIHTDQSNRKRRRLLETEKLHVSLTTSIPFSSTPSDKEKPLSTWGKLKQMVKDYW